MSNFTDIDIALQDIRCRLTQAFGCGDHSYGLDCGEQSIKYNCVLNIDIQNETSYTCSQCNGTMDFEGNSTSCSPRFKLNMVAFEYESALKSLWLQIPSYSCNWDTLFCYSEKLNRTFFIDVFNHSFKNSLEESFQCNWGFSNNTDTIGNSPNYDWSFLFVILFIVAGGVGNILVCLAVCLDKRLQNVTNYFLLSLAIADLLVSLFVMPMGAIPGFLGENYYYFYIMFLIPNKYKL